MDTPLPQDTEAEEHMVAILLTVRRPCEAWRYSISPACIKEQVPADWITDVWLRWLFRRGTQRGDWLGRFQEMKRECAAEHHVDLTTELVRLAERTLPAQRWIFYRWYRARLEEAAGKREIIANAEKEIRRALA